MLKYRWHYALPAESPLAKTTIQEEKPDTANGLSGIALCSSRSRIHHNSGTFRSSRRNSDKELSTSPSQRRSGGGMDKRDSLTEDGSIVLDTSSILDEIMAQTFESEDEKTPSPSRLSNGTASPHRAGLREETQASRQRSSAIDTTSSPALKSKAKQASQKAVPEMSSLAVPPAELHTAGGGSEVAMRAVDRKNEIRRSGSMNKEDYRRSGANWGKLKGNINAGKALGMFYHNRRSQFFEDSFEDQTKGRGLEQKDTNPVSPLAETAVGFGVKAVRTSSSTEEDAEVSVSAWLRVVMYLYCHHCLKLYK